MIENVDAYTLITSALALITAIGGPALVVWRNKILRGLELAAELFDEVADLFFVISEAGKDGKISPEEFTKIQKEAKEAYGKVSELSKILGIESLQE